MAISPELKNFDIVNEFSVISKNAVELKLNLTEEEASKIIWPSAKAVITHAEAENDEIRYGGRVIFNAVINDKELKKIESGVEFSYKVDAQGAQPGDNLTYSVSVENVKVSIVNGIPTASCLLVFTCNVITSKQQEYIYTVNEAFCKKVQVENAKIVLKESKNFSLEDQFELNFVVEEVLWQNQTVKVLEVISGIGCTIIKGELLLDVLYSISEDAQPILDKKVIPFRFEQDISKVMPDLICISNLSVLDFNLKVVVDKNNGKSSVMAFGEIKVETIVYENESVSYVEDAYTLEKELLVNVERKKCCKIVGQKVIESKVYQSAISKNQKNSRLITPLFAKIEQSEVTVNNKELTVNGVIEATILFSGEMGYFTQTALIPFTITEKGVSNSACLQKAVISSLVATDNEDSISLELGVVCYIIDKEDVCFMVATSIEVGEDKEVNASAISVCIPKKGDTLWELSKAFGVSEDEILALNGDLSFPLNGDERIVIYREIK